GLALIAAAVALFFGGRLFPGGSGVAAAIIGGVFAIGCVALGATLSKVYDASSTGVVVAAAGGLPMAFVSGFYTVPGTQLPANFAWARVFRVIVAAASIALIGAGISAFIAAATAGTLGAVTFVFALILDDDLTTAGFAAAAAAVALGLISYLPRATILLAKLPSPVVPSPAEELKEGSEIGTAS